VHLRKISNAPLLSSQLEAMSSFAAVDRVYLKFDWTIQHEKILGQANNSWWVLNVPILARAQEICLENRDKGSCRFSCSPLNNNAIHKCTCLKALIGSPSRQIRPIINCNKKQKPQLHPLPFIVLKEYRTVRAIHNLYPLGLFQHRHQIRAFQ
jgi:hypothetical protein